MTDKMIEEMAKDLKECLPNNWYWQKSVDSDTYLVAKHFYNEGYRKIPEDGVVLSGNQCVEIVQDNYNIGYERGSKETAEEISTNIDLLQESLNKKIEQLKEPFRQNMNYKQKEGYKEGILAAKSIVSSFKYNISKQFDLEVEE